MNDGSTQFKTYSIFKSRLTLKFEDSGLEIKYAQSAENKKENLFFPNILFCGLISLFGIINIGINNFYLEKKKFVILNSIFLFLNCFSILLALLSTKVTFFKFLKNKMDFLLKFINFYTLEMYFFCTIWFEPNLGRNYEFSLFIMAVSSSVKFVYMILIKRNYIPCLFAFLSMLITQSSIIIAYNPWKSLYVFYANLVILLSCILSSFLSELNLRVNFFILESVLRKNIQANMNHASNYYSRNFTIAFNKDFSLSYMNLNMVNYLQNIKNIEVKENTLLVDPEKILRLPNNILRSFWKNKVSTSFINRETIDQNIRESVEELFGKLILINDQLIFKNKKLYDYLLKFKHTNLSEVKLKFEFDEFFQLINEVFIRQNADSVLNVDSNFNQSMAANNTIVHTKESAYLLENKPNILNFNLMTRRRKSRPILKENEYLYLGKILLESTNKNSSSSMSEYYLFFSILKDNQGFCFSIEDFSEIISIEREGTAKICKSLYLSKISHEFKNPITNLIEITNSLEEETSNMILTGNLPKKRSSKLIKYGKPNTLNSDDDSSVEMSFVTSRIERKTLKLEMFQRNTTYLKITSEMMLQLIKDFTFFSHNLDDADPDIFNNISSIRGEAVSNIQESSLNNGSSNILKMKPSFILCCNYKEILSQTISIFNVKSDMENKTDKLSIETKFEPMLPTIVEYDSEKFRSLVFNLIYHIHKSTNSGKIKINVSKVMKNSNLMILIFEFNINGLYSRKNLENDLISERDDESNSKYDDNIIENEIGEVGFNSQNSKNNNQNLPFVEKFHIKNIINATTLQERNNIIDNFNNNFHFYLANIYSKKMGLKLKIKNFTKNSYSISFEMETNSVLSQKKFSSLHIAPKNTGSTFERKEKELPILRKDSDNLENLGRTMSKINSTVSIKKRQGRRNTVSFTKLPKYNQKWEEFRTNSSSNHNDETKTRRTNFPSNFYYPYYITNNINVREIIMKNINQENSSIASMSNFENEINNYEKFIKPHKAFSSKKIEYFSENGLEPNKNRRCQSFRPNTIENLEIKLMNNSKPKYFRNTTLLTKKTMNNSSINLTPEIEESSKSINDFFKVLICDDESLIRKNLHRFLNIIGESDANLNFDVKHAENGFECIAQIYDYYRQNKYFDVLIIDETMPFMKGSQVINLIKSMVREDNFKDITIVSFTSYDSPEKKEYIYSQGADYVLSKPMKIDDFKTFFSLNLRKTAK
jgi:CheY-like chemotaxis protein